MFDLGNGEQGVEAGVGGKASGQGEREKKGERKGWAESKDSLYLLSLLSPHFVSKPLVAQRLKHLPAVWETWV